MMLASQFHYTFPPSVPTWEVYALAALAVGAWVATHFLKRFLRMPLLALAGFVGRVLVGFLAMLAVAQAMQRPLILATNWPIWPLALVGAAAIESILALYAMERKIISRRLGLVLASLRVLAVALVIAMLAQPVKPWTLDKTLERYVAVLLDNSASMYVPDTQLNPSEKMRLALRFSTEGVTRRHYFDTTAEDLDQIRDELGAQNQWLAGLANVASADRQKLLQTRRENLNRLLVEAEKRVGEAASNLAKPPDSKIQMNARTQITADNVTARVSGPVRDRLKEAVKYTSKENTPNLDRDFAPLRTALNQALTDMADLSAKAAGVSQTLDEAAYALLTAEEKARVDAVANAKRIAIARDVMLRSTKRGSLAGKTPGLMEQIKDKWSVLMYEYAAKPVELNLKDWADPLQDADNLDASSSALPPEQQQTDLAAALEKIMSEMSDKQLSGVLLLTDGRNNGPHGIEPLIQRLGASDIPVSSIVFGGTKPPLDAGIMSVEAPETVAPKDRVLVKADLKLDGLPGKEARVTLSDGAKILDTQTVRAVGDVFRTRVELTDEPKTLGLHTYNVEVQSFDGEVLTSNNKYPVTLNVIDEKTNLLMIEGRPRWEFRYLKNLFSGRDKTVRLQYVLLEPDRLDGVPAPRKIEASASRPDGEVEANALPKDETEWMKFDVILLGDVGSKFLKDEELKILERFVKSRSGTLIVSSGPLHMPHEYVGTPLADLLPVVVRKEEKPIVAPPEPRFHIALTADGRDSMITRQRPADDENMKVWDSFPDIYWRHPVLRTLEGATVLAYALPTAPQDFLPRRGEAGANPEPMTDEMLRKRTAFERANPLIAYHSMGTGQVMFFGFDHTWRMRYLTGDTYHHRLWGQVMRWAASGKLPSGTDTIRLGAERTRYAPGAAVRIRARIARKDYTPINGATDVSVNVYEGDTLISTHKMQYIEHSPGMYVGDLGEMPRGGAFRAGLDSPAIKATLAEQNVATVETEFSVDPTTPLEQAELVPDRGSLQRIATQTNGVVAEPSRADRILASFGTPTKKETENHEYVLWDSWLLLLIILAVATTEWLLRKKGGLA
jgi:hypothetical protein